MKEIISKIALVLLTVCVLLPLSALWQGWAVSTLWGWFIVPVGAPEIGVVTATGFALVLTALRMRRNKSGETTNSERFEAVAASIIIPPTLVFMGWIIKTFA